MKLPIKTAIVLASFALGACDNPQDAKPTPPAPATTTAPATPAATNLPTTTAGPQGAAAGTVTIADSDLATPADFEAQEELAITSKNYKSEIASLEAEIGKP
jgi:hypothetical protein